jgi:hypothetical protein
MKHMKCTTVYRGLGPSALLIGLAAPAIAFVPIAAADDTVTPSPPAPCVNSDPNCVAGAVVPGYPPDIVWTSDCIYTPSGSFRWGVTQGVQQKYEC